MSMRAGERRQGRNPSPLHTLHFPADILKLTVCVCLCVGRAALQGKNIPLKTGGKCGEEKKSAEKCEHQRKMIATKKKEREKYIKRNNVSQ